MSLEELYREVVLDHYRNPRNRGKLDDATVRVEGTNPLCGDEIELDLRIEDGRLTDIALRGQGCSISQASASMMSEAVKGRSLEEVEDLIARFKGMMGIEGGVEPELDPERIGAVLGDLEALQGVRQFPVRIKCAALPWTSLEQALDEARAA